ncbi:MAG TPA: hypothetical protein ENN36_07445 [Candidatus Bathyarchaeota archaeon]|nr:hypothetical protein [Candidatus Bathyarchaeota archaeon]
MKAKFAVYPICLAALLSLIFSAVASADVLVGVKPGDWVTYNVQITGEVPEQHDVTWCKIEVIEVEGNHVYVDITYRHFDGREETKSSTLKFETGHVGEAFMIPANSDKGDTFSSYEGPIIIGGVEKASCAGAIRSVVYASTSVTVFHWDRSTGFLVEANSSSSEYTMFTKAEKTNMWQPQIFGLDQTAFVALVLVIVTVSVLAVFLIRKLKK